MVAGPQVKFDDLTTLVATFRESWGQVQDEAPTRVGAWRPILVGSDPSDAYEKAVAGGRLTFPRYQGGAMQETTMVPLALELRSEDVAEWAIMGDYSHILAGLRHCARHHRPHPRHLPVLQPPNRLRRQAGLAPSLRS